ncbi:DUF2017 family protein [Gleimia hominis]|uniref:DUF2017 family protein n=1 Tax=Gleimia hominis TaxID=595468 RepID=A0ABU3IBR8_9ACTO|nr:DUF2017 family protein [Gleimia hominis]MDT3767817.1 DUF2017 family protein [Gleimia hominis]
MYISVFERDEQGYRAAFDADVEAIFTQLLGEALQVLDAPVDPVTSVLTATVEEEVTRPEPQDPALRKLIPPLSSDPQEAQKLRALTEESLRYDKSQRLHALLQCLQERESPEEIWIPLGQEWEWLAALNDLRLVLSAQLPVDDAEVMGILTTRAEQILFAGGPPEASENSGTWLDQDPDAPQLQFTAVIYVMVSWWQDSLIQILPQ